MGKLTKNVGRIDHVVITVSPANFEACVEKLRRTLDIEFPETLRRDDLGVIAAVSWEAGIEVLAPTNETGPIWERLKERGEGHMAVVFGVEDFERARQLAEGAGVTTGPEVGLSGDEPWADRFKVLRETSLSPIFGANITLGEIEPYD